MKEKKKVKKPINTEKCAGGGKAGTTLVDHGIEVELPSSKGYMYNKK